MRTRLGGSLALQACASRWRAKLPLSQCAGPAAASLSRRTAGSYGLSHGGMETKEGAARYGLPLGVSGPFTPLGSAARDGGGDGQGDARGRAQPERDRLLPDDRLAVLHDLRFQGPVVIALGQLRRDEGALFAGGL